MDYLLCDGVNYLIFILNCLDILNSRGPGWLNELGS